MARTTTHQDINTGEWTTTGRTDSRTNVRPVTITTSTDTTNRVRHLWETTTGNIYNQCGRCDATGTNQAALHVLGGICFDCNGTGLGKPVPGGLDAACKREKTNAAADRRRSTKRQAHWDQLMAEGTAWREDNPELTTELLALFNDNSSPEGDDLLGLSREERQDPHYVVWFRAEHSILGGRFTHLFEYVGAVANGRALSEKGTAYVTDKLAAYREAIAEQAAQRYAGEVGDKVTVTGTVAKTHTCESAYGISRMVIVEGTGDDDGITLITFSNAKAIWELDEDQTVTMTGEVKKLGERDGVKQTQVKRPKLT